MWGLISHGILDVARIVLTHLHPHIPHLALLDQSSMLSLSLACGCTDLVPPIRFFAGRTQGTGSLKIVLHSRQATLVTGVGVADGDRSIVLDQEVRRGDDSPTHRTWHLQALGAGHYRGTLSDATGPVTGEVDGNRLHLRFAMKGGLQAQQWLYLQPGGQIARNRMVITKFGLSVASLDETITRVAP